MMASMMLLCPYFGVKIQAASAKFYAKCSVEVESTQDGENKVYGKGYVSIARQGDVDVDYQAYNNKSEYVTRNTTIGYATEPPTNANITFNLTAENEDEYIFDYWSSSDEDEEFYASINPFSVTINSTSTTAEDPTSKGYIAHFRKADVQADMYMSKAGVSTFASHAEVYIPQGCTGYTVDLENGELVFKKAYGEYDIVPPYTPIVVCSDVEVKKAGVIASSYTLTKYIDKSRYDENSDGYLCGVYDEGAYLPKGCYVLQVNNGELAFCKIESDDVPATQYRCYLIAPESMSSESKIRVSMASEATAISAVENAPKAQDGVYSINGVKQSAEKDGINIVVEDGKAKKILK